MIDILISEGGLLTVAHDAGDLPRLANLAIDQDGHVTGIEEDGGRVAIGKLSETMMDAAAGVEECQVVVLVGWDPDEIYPCKIRLPSAG